MLATSLPGSLCSWRSYAQIGVASLGVLAGCGGDTPEKKPVVAPVRKSEVASEFVGSGEASLSGPGRAKVKAPNVPDQKYAQLHLKVKPSARGENEVELELDHGPFAGCVVPALRQLSGLVPRRDAACDFVYAGRSESQPLDVYVRKDGSGDDISGEVKADLGDALLTFKFTAKRKP